MGNPVWKAFVAEQMEVWLDWFRNNHVDSYIDIIEKFGNSSSKVVME